MRKKKKLSKIRKKFFRMFCKFFDIEFCIKKIKTCSPDIIHILLKRCNASIGEKINFKEGLIIDNAIGDVDAKNSFENISIGNNCFIGKNVFIDLANKVIFDDHVVISARVNILTHSDCGGRAMSKFYPRKSKPVKIGYGSWVGVNATILPGISIGKYCVIGAGSVVTKNIPDYSVAAGVPAKIIKSVQ